MTEYPLYDVPWLVREANGRYGSQKRYEIELRNQAVVDEYFILRDQKVCAEEARRRVATKHGISSKRVLDILVWFCHEAEKRQKYDFLEKFSLL